MKILHTADSHFAPNTVEEAVRCFKPIIETAQQEKVDLIIHAGDLYDKNMLMNSPARTQSVKLMKELADIAPIILIRGNHDPEGSLDELPLIKTSNPIYLFTEIKHRTFDDYRFEIIAVPYIKKSEFDIPDGLSIIESDKYVAQEMVKKFSSFPAKKYNRFFVGHITITNSTLANSQTISSNDILISPKDLLKADADAYFLGHIHQHEQKILKDLPAKYSGPHYRTRFDETQELGFWIWEDGVWYRFKTPARKAITITVTEEQIRYHIENDKDFDLSEWADEWENSDIKLKLDVPEDLSHLIDQELLEEITGARVEKRVIPKNTARSQEISTVNSLLEKLRIWAKEKKVDINEDIDKYVMELENDSLV